MSKSTRRTFLMQAAGAAAACATIPRIARADVNSQVRMATIGFNGRGGSHISAFKNQPGCIVRLRLARVGQGRTEV
jgi:hypothetical protein